jgi:enamine deaminase RidA (YjgF/YER057c/UK114 family)
MRAGSMPAALAALAVAGPAVAQTRGADTVLMSTNERMRADQERYGFSDAVIAGDLIFLSGIVTGMAPGETDLKPGYERAFKAIGRILERAGASYGDIVDVTSFHTDVVGQIEALSEVQKKYLGAPPPAWTAIDVDRLLPENGLTEIKIVARRPAAAAKR